MIFSRVVMTFKKRLEKDLRDVLKMSLFVFKTKKKP